MKDITEISELDKWLSDLPETIKYKDGDTLVKAVNHLRRLVKCYHKYKDKGIVWQ